MMMTMSAKLSLPWKARLGIALYDHITYFARCPDGTINRRHLDFFDRKSPPNPIPIDGVSTFDISVDPDRNLWFHVFTPVDDADASSYSMLPVIIFFHSGGFHVLSPPSNVHDELGRRYARDLHAVYVSVNYRLTPEHRFPSQYDDGIDALKFLDSNPQVLPSNANLSNTFLCGDSAGSNIAHHVAVRTCQSGQYPLKRMKLVGLILLQPYIGGAERTESEMRLPKAPMLSLEKTDWYWKEFIPDEDRDHWAINVSGPNAVDLAAVDGFPDMLVVIGGYDMLRDWQKRYYEWVKRSGKGAELVDYPGACHSFYVFPELPEFGQLVMEVKRFVGRRCELYGSFYKDIYGAGRSCTHSNTITTTIIIYGYLGFPSVVAQLGVQKHAKRLNCIANIDLLVAGLNGSRPFRFEYATVSH